LPSQAFVKVKSMMPATDKGKSSMSSKTAGEIHPFNID